MTDLTGTDSRTLLSHRPPMIGETVFSTTGYRPVLRDANPSARARRKPCESAVEFNTRDRQRGCSAKQPAIPIHFSRKLSSCDVRKSNSNA